MHKGKNSKNDKLKRHETLEEERREQRRRVGSGAGCGGPVQAPYGLVSEQRGTEVAAQEQWLSLWAGPAVQSHKMSSPYEADHCSLSCFPFSSFHWFKQPVLLAVSLTCLSPQAPQQPFNTNIKRSHQHFHPAITLVCCFLCLFVCLFVHYNCHMLNHEKKRHTLPAVP